MAEPRSTPATKMLANLAPELRVLLRSRKGQAMLAVALITGGSGLALWQHQSKATSRGKKKARSVLMRAHCVGGHFLQEDASVATLAGVHSAGSLGLSQSLGVTVPVMLLP